MFLRRADKARRKHADQDRAQYNARRGDQKQGQAEHGGRLIHEGLEFSLAALGLIFGQHGHEGLRKPALGKQPAQKIGDAKGHEEDIHAETRPKQARDDDIADQAEHPGDAGHQADGKGGFQQADTHLGRALSAIY